MIQMPFIRTRNELTQQLLTEKTIDKSRKTTAPIIDNRQCRVFQDHQADNKKTQRNDQPFPVRQKINLQVRRSNSEVIGFYQAVGFKEDDVMSLGLRLNGSGST